jgi:prolyl oligopeptidase
MKKPVTDEYHGVKVVDDYRWLENFEDPAVKQWVAEQNKYSRGVIDKYADWQPLYDKLKQLATDSTASYYGLMYRGHKLFAMKNQPPKNQPFLVVLDAALDLNTEKVVVDPNVLDKKGGTSIDWFVPSHDGRMVAMSLSENGSEDGSASVFDVATGKKYDDLVPRVQYPTAGGDIEWNADNSGFYYTRFPQGKERPPEDLNFYQQVYYHAVGTPVSRDQYVIGKEFPRIAEIRLSLSEDGRSLLVTVANGDGGEFMHFLRGPSGKWVQVTRFEDRIQSAKFGPDGNLYMLSRKGAPKGRILSLPAGSGQTVTTAREVFPEGSASISEFLPTQHFLYVVEVAGGPQRIRYQGITGNQKGQIPTESIASTGGLVRVDDDVILFGSETYLLAPAIYRFDPSSGGMEKTALSRPQTVDYSDIEVVREFATSKDGTKIPINILRRKGTVLNGDNPTNLYAYGGFDVSLSPGYSRELRLWFDVGGVAAIANLRGGGEYGEEWHEAGKLTKKQNVFDDFAACARWLIDNRYTKPEKLVIEGGSNGGLLMGAALTQHPELFRAVVSWVGIYDMLRVETFPNGQFNITEYGTIQNPEQFKAEYAYSPYHMVRDGTNYPAILMLTGDNDGRVDPANSRKMVARLQAANTSGLPVILRTSSNAGHGIGTSLDERVSQGADALAFQFQELGLRYPAK